jgi:hypothetical protein
VRTLTMFILAAALSIIVCVLAVSGCGSSTSSTTAQSVTHNTATTSTSATTPSPVTATGKIGQAATVGSLKITPTSFVRVGTSSGPTGPESHYRLTMTVQNAGAQAAKPFCAGEQASVTDQKDRIFQGEDLKPGQAGAVNCTEVQPSHSGSPYLVDFFVPTGSVPKTVSAWGEDQYESQTAHWQAH